MALTAAIAGTGFIGRVHARSLRLAGVELVGRGERPQRAELRCRGRGALRRAGGDADEGGAEGAHRVRVHRTDESRPGNGSS